MVAISEINILGNLLKMLKQSDCDKSTVSWEVIQQTDGTYATGVKSGMHSASFKMISQGKIMPKFYEIHITNIFKRTKSICKVRSHYHLSYLYD